MVHDPFAIPDRFDLLFSPIAQSWRECLIIARRYGAKSITISFLARHLPLYSGQHSVLGQQIPQGSNRAADVGPIDFPAWSSGTVAAIEVIE